MNDDPTKKLSDAEESALRALGGDIEPSPELEGRLVAALKRRGDIRANGGWVMKSMKALAAAVVAGILFTAGFAVGNREQAQKVVINTTPESANQYMLLMYTRTSSPDQASRLDAPRQDIQTIIAEYRDWAIAREQEGRLVSAEKLSDETRVMTRHANEIEIAAAPVSDRVLGGYFLITAPSLDKAIELAKSHPHLKYGGEVEVRPIEFTR